MERLYTVQEAADIKKVTRQAIYLAIKEKKLASKKDGWQVKVSLRDLEDYQRNRFSRLKSTRDDGELVYNQDQGYLTVAQTSQILDIPAQKVYYELKKGNLRSTRNRSAWVIHIDDVLEFRKVHLSYGFEEI